MKQEKSLVKDTDATIIGLQAAYDKNLTPEEKGVYYMINCLPDDCSVTIENISNVARIGKDKAGTILNKLREAGYLKRQKKNDGTVVTKVMFNPAKSSAQSLQETKNTQSISELDMTSKMNNYKTPKEEKLDKENADSEKSIPPNEEKKEMEIEPGDTQKSDEASEKTETKKEKVRKEIKIESDDSEEINTVFAKMLRG